MARLPFTSMFKIIFEAKSSLKFLIGTISSFAFSIAVILATIGLMDGFEFTLKQALSHSNGDIKFSAKDGHFVKTDALVAKFSEEEIRSTAFVLQVEAFAISEGRSKGILLKGIEYKDFSQITNLNLKDLGQGIAIGKTFADYFNISVGDSVVLAISTARHGSEGDVLLREFEVRSIISHGIYEKDLRFVYMEKKVLENLMGYKDDVSNLGLIKINNFQNLNEIIKQLKYKFEGEFSFQPFWNEFKVLIEAVEVEKISISIILQLIVIVAILNVVAFTIFISEKKSQDFFMLRALGLSLKSLQRFWFITFLGIWGLSCLLGYFLVIVFDQIILKLPFLKIPGDIYVISDLKIILDNTDYAFVFGLSLIWIMLIGIITMSRLKRKPLIAGLRQEFS